MHTKNPFGDETGVTCSPSPGKKLSLREEGGPPCCTNCGQGGVIAPYGDREGLCVVDTCNMPGQEGPYFSFLEDAKIYACCKSPGTTSKKNCESVGGDTTDYCLSVNDNLICKSNASKPTACISDCSFKNCTVDEDCRPPKSSLPRTTTCDSGKCNNGTCSTRNTSGKDGSNSDMWKNAKPCLLNTDNYLGVQGRATCTNSACIANNYVPGGQCVGPNLSCSNYTDQKDCNTPRAGESCFWRNVKMTDGVSIVKSGKTCTAGGGWKCDSGYTCDKVNGECISCTCNTNAGANPICANRSPANPNKPCEGDEECSDTDYCNLDTKSCWTIGTCEITVDTSVGINSSSSPSKCSNNIKQKACQTDPGCVWTDGKCNNRPAASPCEGNICGGETCIVDQTSSSNNNIYRCLNTTNFAPSLKPVIGQQFTNGTWMKPPTPYTGGYHCKTDSDCLGFSARKDASQGSCNGILPGPDGSFCDSNTTDLSTQTLPSISSADVEAGAESATYSQGAVTVCGAKGNCPKDPLACKSGGSLRCKVGGDRRLL